MGRIVTMTMNPAFDLYTTVERLVPRSKLRTGDFALAPGGGGVNASSVIHALGGDTAAILPVGGMAGQELLDALRRRGFAGLPVPIGGETRRNLTVLERASGEQFRLVGPGPGVTDRECRAVLGELARLDPAPAWVVTSGSMPPGVPEGFLAEVAGIVARLGARWAVDTSGDALDAAVRHRPHLVKPNHGELARLLGHDPDRRDVDHVAWARELVDSGVETVVVSLGGDGALAVDATGAVVGASAPPVQILSTVGAGDSMVGAMVLALEQGMPLVDALARGVAAGTATCASPGPELCTASEVDALLPLVAVTAR